MRLSRPSRSRLLVAALVLCAGDVQCFSPEYGPKPFLCNTANRCPAGYHCYNGLCVNYDANVVVDSKEPYPDTSGSDLVLQDASSDEGPAGDLFGPSSTDLELQNFQLTPTTIKKGTHPSVISYRIVNHGPLALAAPNTRVAIAFYFSTDSTFGNGDDTPVGGVGLNYTLAVGASKNGSLSSDGLTWVIIPTTLAAGTYHAFAKIVFEAPSTLTDPKPANNVSQYSASITVQ